MPNNSPNQSETMNLKIASNQIKSYIKAFHDSFMYRENEIMILVVSLIIGKNACFIGSHGEAKSALIEQFAKGIDKKFFGCQFNRFSTPDEILGHFSLAEMKNNDQYVRKYQGKLPDAQIAYLDECFNASGAMLQSLQKALNEKRIDLGNGTELSIPMELSIASTNFHCSKNQQLAAFWDRFFLRIETKNTVSQFKKSEFRKFMELKRTGQLGRVNTKLDNKVIDFFRASLAKVTISKDIDSKLYELLEFCNKNNIDISARRLVWIDDAIKAMALISGRDYVNDSDLSILQHCLWVHIEQYDLIETFLKKVCHSPVKEINGHLFDLKCLKLDYINLDSRSISEKDRKLRIALINEMGNKENAMIAIVQTVFSKDWPDSPEINEIKSEIQKYNNPTKFLL